MGYTPVQGIIGVNINLLALNTNDANSWLTVVQINYFSNAFHNQSYLTTEGSCYKFQLGLFSFVKLECSPLPIWVFSGYSVILQLQKHPWQVVLMVDINL